MNFCGEVRGEGAGKMEKMPARHDRKRNEVFHITQDNIYNVSVPETRKFFCTLIFFIRRDVYDHRAGE